MIRKKTIYENLTAWLYLLPNLSGFLLFSMIPVIFAVILSFFKWDVFNSPEFVGLQNFRNLLGWTYSDGQIIFNDPDFWKYLYNTLFLMMGIPLNMLAALCIAMLLNRKMKGISFFRTVFYLPSICAGVAVYMLWACLYNPEYGIINTVLGFVGIEGPGWLTEYEWSKPSLMLIELWAAMGGTNMLLYLAGLQGISEELYEAAEIDGASGFQKFWHITVPMLAPTNFFIFVMSVIGGFQGGFDAAFILTQGGPAGSTTTLSYYIYNHAFEWFNMGYAATISLVLFAIVMLVTIINWCFGGKNECV